MNGYTISVDVTLFILLVLIPTVVELWFKHKGKDKSQIPLVLQVPYGVRITVVFIILFTFYFSSTMKIV